MMRVRAMMTAAAVVGLSVGVGHAAASDASDASETERAAAPKIPVLLITGVNNHNWPFTSRVHKETLEATGRFAVDLTETPEAVMATPEAIAKYRVFVFDYNDVDKKEAGGWDPAARKAFQMAVRGGAGVVAIHSANNSFKGWSEWEHMIGWVWREGAGHGKVHPFDVEMVDKDHPIMAGLPAAGFTAHMDELYHGQSNPQLAKPRLLMRAMSSKESGGTGQFEPMAWTLPFGDGRIFTTLLGHVWVGDQNSKKSVLDPQFRTLLSRGTEWAATGSVTLPAAWSDSRDHNTLSDEEQKAGWVSLFDGVAPIGFRGFKKDAMPEKGWVVRDGCLVHEAQGGGGDIVTREEFGDFEFVCQWKVAKGGNSGIMYRCDEKHNYPWETGREMQILDDDNHNDGKKPKTRAGTMYDVFACGADVCRPFGEWNEARVVCRGTQVEHWLNGIKVVSIDTESDEYKSAVAASKFPGMKDYGSLMRGRIALQDHGDEVMFRGVKVRGFEPRAK